MRFRGILLIGSIASAISWNYAAADSTSRALNPDYERPPAAIVNEYRSFLLSHPGSSLEVAKGGGGSFIVKFSGTGACKGLTCMTTVLLPDGQGRLFQAFSQETKDLRIIPNPQGGPPDLSTADGGVWVPAGSIYVEDLRSLGRFAVPTHFLGGDTKRQIDKLLQEEHWPESAPYDVSVVPPSGNAPETMIVIPDQSTKQGIDLCAGVACPLWILVPNNSGGWVVDVKTAGSGGYAVLNALNADGGHDLGIADQYGWNRYSWSDTQSRWELTHVTANLPNLGK